MLEKIKEKVEAYNKIANASRELPFEQIKKLMPIPKNKESSKRKKLEKILKEYSINKVEFLIEDIWEIIVITGHCEGYTKTVFEFDRDTHKTYIHHLNPIPIHKVEEEFAVAEKIINYVKKNTKNITISEILSYIKDEIKILL